ncbi:MAG: hypothetical protein KDB23_25835 [Planctomycetales bacterium]|nr:hypothetical protein [Planctomycetales bacterium]
MRPRFRFGIDRLLLMISILALVLVVGRHLHWRYFSPEGAYQLRKQGAALLVILADELNNGDSREYVIRMLGPGSTIDDEESLARIRQTIRQFPLSHADGIQESDMFVMYSTVEGFALHLQFREDKLVNFDLSMSTKLAMRQLSSLPTDR